MSLAQILCVALGAVPLFAIFALALVNAMTPPPRGVQVGDLWETNASRWTHGCYEVVAPNGSTEAGPDSWLMRSIDGREAYMHHGRRVAGKWWLVMRDGKPTEMRHRRAQQRGGLS